MFTFLDYLKEEVDLEAQTIDGTRFYKVPSGKMYPSITSVTSFYNRDVFINWRKKVGEEKANKITRESTFRGTKYHDVVEYYMRNGTIDGLDMLPSTKFLFLSSKKNLDRIDNSIVLVDESENLNFHELDSIITRLGVNSKIVFAGDAAQTDLQKAHEKTGIMDFKKIIDDMDEFESIEFGIDDIVRSGLVKSYLISKLNLGI